jgi:N-glycosylase/DNA lyase
MGAPVEYGAGIRILRQERWEALCSFILSQCNNIPRIKKIIETLCAYFGAPVDFMGRSYFTFPTAEQIAALSPEDLAPLRSGYRAPYVIAAARAVASGELDLDALAGTDTATARAALKALPGVGDKVANCAILFGLHQLDAFPIDTWMKKAISANFGDGFDPKIFSPYAGIAQQYLFYHARETGR